MIGERAFTACWGLTEIKIPSSVRKLGSMSFFWCKNLKKVEFAKNSKLEEIKASAFSGCETLTEITIPRKVKKIGGLAFYLDHNLRKVTFLGKVPKIKKSTFSEIHKETVFYTPKKYKTSYEKKLKKQPWYKATMIIR